MEGPTPSSAIFYGALSVHMGVFLLVRVSPFWMDEFLFRWIMGIVGLITFIINYLLARFQYTIKAKIGFQSLSNIGIIFIELSLGMIYIVIIHTFINAILKTYQLFISPSSISYMIRNQFFHFQPKARKKFTYSWSKKLHYTFNTLCVKEFYLDLFWDRIIFGFFRKLGKKLDFLTPGNVLFFLAPIIILALVSLFTKYFPMLSAGYIPEFLSFIGFVLMSKAFSERKYPRLVWLLNIITHFLILISVMLLDSISRSQILLYVFGILGNGILGYFILYYIYKREKEKFNLNEYHGHILSYKMLSKLFFISNLGLMGFPISTTFLGEDLILSHIHTDRLIVVFFFSVSYILGGISLIRLYSKIFLGPNARSNYGTALHSA